MRRPRANRLAYLASSGTAICGSAAKHSLHIARNNISLAWACSERSGNGL